MSGSSLTTEAAREKVSFQNPYALPSQLQAFHALGARSWRKAQMLSDSMPSEMAIMFRYVAYAISHVQLDDPRLVERALQPLAGCVFGASLADHLLRKRSALALGEVRLGLEPGQLAKRLLLQPRVEADGLVQVAAERAAIEHRDPRFHEMSQDAQHCPGNERVQFRLEESCR